MTKMSETRIHRQQNLGLVEEGFICFVLLEGNINVKISIKL